jgi:hypothetical protein
MAAGLGPLRTLCNRGYLRSGPRLNSCYLNSRTSFHDIAVSAPNKWQQDPVQVLVGGPPRWSSSVRHRMAPGSRLSCAAHRYWHIRRPVLALTLPAKPAILSGMDVIDYRSQQVHI